jgi:hypothetical protein
VIWFMFVPKGLTAPRPRCRVYGSQCAAFPQSRNSVRSRTSDFTSEIVVRAGPQRPLRYGLVVSRDRHNPGCAVTFSYRLSETRMLRPAGASQTGRGVRPIAGCI